MSAFIFNTDDKFLVVFTAGNTFDNSIYAEGNGAIPEANAEI